MLLMVPRWDFKEASVQRSWLAKGAHTNKEMEKGRGSDLRSWKEKCRDGSCLGAGLGIVVQGIIESERSRD